MTHGFDDGAGSTTPRATSRTGGRLKTRRPSRSGLRLLVKQFDAYEPIPGMHINGTLTLGENLADLGGLAIAYDAFKLARQGSPAADPQDGFTPEQRFS